MTQNNSDINEYTDDNDFDPIHDIIDYLVRCAEITFKNSHPNENNLKTVDKTAYAHNLYLKSPTQFLMQFGKFLSPNHLQYFETLSIYKDNQDFNKCVSHLKVYHSEESRSKRIRNRRYKALQKLQEETDYFSEKEMMYRNPLLYEQLVGQYLLDEEIQERDAVDSDNLTLLGLILETVDRNQMREVKNVQMLDEDKESTSNHSINNNQTQEKENSIKKKQWGDFDVPDTKDTYTPEIRKQTMINANEKRILREEFYQEMYSSFIEGRDTDFDYNNVDNNEDYDDLEQISQDAEDKYFDSEQNDSETLEEHMTLIQEYSSKNSNDNGSDPLDVFMQHISNKLNKT
ncbi:coiled-coil domain-containing protein 97 [Zerene cesonia]|uniref:coiled-coil domain-containing protein 97 n=1 Tax=Zerene cesonia TaxID=33412 RepID=UPI0018E4E6C3|nr:coiled-coil domain-containing protein 97 [Zerene cesonia]